MAGQSCDTGFIRRSSSSIANEDASHAIGAKHLGEFGSCRYSDITVFSFHPVKIIMR